MTAIETYAQTAVGAPSEWRCALGPAVTTPTMAFPNIIEQKQRFRLCELSPHMEAAAAPRRAAEKIGAPDLPR